MRLSILTTLVLGLAATPLVAGDVVSFKDGQKQLFKAKGRHSVAHLVRPDLIEAKQHSAIDFVADKQKYYGAMAISPSRGLMDTAASLASNYHSVEDAAAVAVATCNAKIENSDEPCVVLAYIIPKNYPGTRPFQLNVDASLAFGREYKRSKTARAFATSRATGHWGYASGAGSADAAAAGAIQSCAAKGAADCAVVAAD